MDRVQGLGLGLLCVRARLGFWVEGVGFRVEKALGVEGLGVAGSGFRLYRAPG